MIRTKKKAVNKSFGSSIQFFVFLDPLAATVGCLSFILLILTLTIKPKATPVILSQEQIAGLEIDPATIFIEAKPDSIVIHPDQLEIPLDHIFYDSDALSPLNSKIEAMYDQTKKPVPMMVYMRNNSLSTYNQFRNSIDIPKVNLTYEQLPDSVKVLSALLPDESIAAKEKKIKELIQEGIDFRKTNKPAVVPPKKMEEPNIAPE